MIDDRTPTALLPLYSGDLASHPSPPVLEVVVPVHNEERDLERCVRTLYAFLRDHLPFSAAVTIADNASTDATPRIARRLAEELPGVRVHTMAEKGRGRSLKAVWSRSEAEIVAYMDVDLSTDLNALLPLVAPLRSGHSDLAIGTRLQRSARVVRGPKRELISRSYNLILRGALGARFSDAQCGFKAARGDVVRALLPYVEDDTWFFDTELLVLAEQAGLRIHEVPVDWTDDPDSTVDIARTAKDDLKGVWRMGKALVVGSLPLQDIRAEFGRRPLSHAPRTLLAQLVRFGLVGVASTVAYVLLFLGLETTLSSQAANFVALMVTAVANTAVNRWFTFGVRGRQDVARHHILGLAVFLFGWAVSSGALTVLHWVSPVPATAVELGVLVAANLVATVVRFVLLRGWVFRPGPRRTPVTPVADRAR